MKKWTILILAALVLPAASAVAKETSSQLVAGTVKAVHCAESCEVELDVSIKGEPNTTRVACVEPRLAEACRALLVEDAALIAVRGEASILQATHVALLLHTVPTAAAAEGLADVARFVDLELEFDQVVRFGGLRIHFKEVVEDSRCPEDVVCVWGGRCVIVLALWHGMTFLGDYELIEGEDPALSEIEAEGYFVRLTRMLPVPTSDSGPIDPSKYTITLRVAKP